MRRRRLREQRHNDQLVVDAKHERLRRGEPHTADIAALVDEIAAATYGPGSVPYPDPEFAGVHARALMLLQDPSRMARNTWTLVCTIRMAVRHQASQVLMSGLVSSLRSSRPIPGLSG
jgi:hypothetical protein